MQNVRDQGLEHRGAECQGSRFRTERSRVSGIKVWNREEQNVRGQGLEQGEAECQGSRFRT